MALLPHLYMLGHKWLASLTQREALVEISKLGTLTTTGLILVEIKPIRYELKITQIAQQNKSKIARIQNIVKSQMMNKGSSNIKFTVKKTIKWGHINGVLKGLPVTVGNIHVVWGLMTSKVAYKVKCKK